MWHPINAFRTSGIYYKIKLIEYYNDEIPFDWAALDNSNHRNKWVMTVENSFGRDGTVEFYNCDEAEIAYYSECDTLDRIEEMVTDFSEDDERRRIQKSWVLFLSKCQPAGV